MEHTDGVSRVGRSQCFCRLCRGPRAEPRQRHWTERRTRCAEAAGGQNDYAIAPGVPVPRVLNPLVSPLALFIDTVGQSTYHAGTVTLNKRFSRHYALTANYTWSKTLITPGASRFPICRRMPIDAIWSGHVQSSTCPIALSEA